MTEAKEQLHPGAAVFRTVLLNEISEETESLRKNVARLQPLLDTLQKIEVTATVGGGEMNITDGNFQMSPSIIETISTLKLSQGKVQVSPSGEDMLVLPILPSKELSLKHFGLNGGIGVNLGGNSLGFSGRSFNSRISNCINDSFIVHVGENDTATLTIFISESTYIVGDLNGLSNEDIVAIKEDPKGGGTTIMSYTMSMFDGQTRGECPTFTPNTIVMALSDTLKDTLQTIGCVTKPKETLTDSEKLREVTITGKSAFGLIRLYLIAFLTNVTFSSLSSSYNVHLPALGDEDHKKLLDDNMRLKSQQEALMKIRDLLLKVDISHSEGSFSFSLDEGEVSEDETGHPKWRIKVEGKEMSSIALIDLFSISLSISGTDVSQHMDRMNMVYSPTILNDENGFPSGMKIRLLDGVSAAGIFNWNAHSQDELSEMADDFRGKLRSSLMGGNVYRDDVPIPMLPPTFKLRLLHIDFAPDLLLSPNLKMTGVGEELLSKIEQEETVSIE